MNEERKVRNVLACLKWVHLCTRTKKVKVVEQTSLKVVDSREISHRVSQV